MRNHDIVVLLRLRVSFFSFMCFSLLCMKLRNGIRVHTIKIVSSVMLGISIIYIYVTVRIGVRHGLYGGRLK